jgi:deoxyribodipyrimidine photo-lyase
MAECVIVWFRRDLRLGDHAALEAARGRAIVPVFIWSPEEEGVWAPGAASRWWLHHSLTALDGDLRKRGSRLVVRTGPAPTALADLVRETGACAVHWHRRYEPWASAQEASVERTLTAMGCSARAFDGSLLAPPDALCNASGRPFQVFTPFYRSLLQRLAVRGLAAPDPPPTRLGPVPAHIASQPLTDLELLPRIPWDRQFRQVWRPGEAGAQDRLRSFLAKSVCAYAEKRDRPDLDGVSRLSPHLHFGEISPLQIWHAAQGIAGAEPFLRQLVWREFSYHLLQHFPNTPTEPLRAEFAAFPWRTDPDALLRWQRGRTGYPIVDAGMRQLWAIGWMHNRVRMLVASFLTKDLLIPWQEGARWFWDTLVDADLANNTQGWQWTAGCGADAAPYFRIFNPVIQGMKFDPDGAYVRQWVPELARMPSEWIHRPWEAPNGVLAEAGVVLGDTYPDRMVDHADAREQALQAYTELRGGASRHPD